MAIFFTGMKIMFTNTRVNAQVKLLMSFSGNLSVLAEADQFMVQLVKVPGCVWSFLKQGFQYLFIYFCPFLGGVTHTFVKYLTAY